MPIGDRIATDQVTGQDRGTGGRTADRPIPPQKIPQLLVDQCVFEGIHHPPLTATGEPDPPRLLKHLSDLRIIRLLPVREVQAECIGGTGLLEETDCFLAVWRRISRSGRDDDDQTLRTTRMFDESFDGIPGNLTSPGKNHGPLGKALFMHRIGVGQPWIQATTGRSCQGQKVHLIPRLQQFGPGEISHRSRPGKS